jgi:predicted TIM-barrel fold metal-dependent hydrolase
MSEPARKPKSGGAPERTHASGRLLERCFVVSADCHVNEPADLWATRIAPEFRERIPRVRVDADGTRWSVAEGLRPVRIKDFPREFTQGQAFSLEAGDLDLSQRGSADPAIRNAHHDLDGVDAEIVYPNKGLLMWTSPDHRLAAALCRVWNDWAVETFGAHSQRILPVAAVAPGDVPAAVREVQRVARLGLRSVFLPVQVAGQPYSLPLYDPLWAALQDAGLPVAFHVGTGRDPRSATGHGGAVINYVVHALATAMEPLTQLCASGVCERFPGLRFALVECGIGWLAWALWAMDESFVKHDFWVSPKLPLKPSEYFRRQGWCTFCDDPMGIATREWIGTERLLFGNDYPHHEGSWPHSEEVVRRTMGDLTDTERRLILGENAARLYGIPLPG